MESRKEQGLDQEASLYLELGNMLQKERPREKQEEVRLILDDRELSNSEKLEKIRRIDSQEEGASSQASSRPGSRLGAGPVPEDKAAALETQTLRMVERISHQWSLLKKPLHRAGWFHFLFRDYRKIRDFSRRSHTLLISWVPPRIRLSRGLGLSASHSFQKTARQLYSLLQPVREMGWLILDKQAYNRLALLQRFCREVLALRIDGALPAVHGLESCFYALLLDNSLPEINAALKQLKIHRGGLVEDPEQITRLARELIVSDAQRPSLPDFIRAVNMVRYRRYLDWDDLRMTSSPGLISDEVFDTPPHVSRRIANFLQSTDKKMEVLHKHWTQIQQMKRYVPRDEEDRLDLSVLVDFYEKSPDGTSREYVFKNDKKMLNLFFYRLVSSLLGDYQELLIGELTLEGRGRTAVFTPTCFEKTAAKLYQLRDNFDTLSTTFPSFTRQRFFDLQRTKNRGAIAIEREAASWVTEACRTLRYLSVHLSHMLMNERSAEEPEGNGKEKKLSPVGSVSLKDASFLIPGAGEVIKNPKPLQGLTVRGALTGLTQLGYLVHAHFMESDFSQTLEKEKAISTEISKRLDRIARVGRSEDIEQAEDKVFPFRSSSGSGTAGAGVPPSEP